MKRLQHDHGNSRRIQGRAERNSSRRSWASRGASRLAALCCHTQGTAGLTFSYDSIHNQPAWIKLLGEVQGSLGRVLICLEVHIMLQPQLVLCGENGVGEGEAQPQELQLQGSGVFLRG